MEIKIAEQIRALRKRSGYRSAAALAAALCLSGYDCSASLVKSWEAGVRYPTLPAVRALCDLLTVSADELIFGTEK